MSGIPVAFRLDKKLIKRIDRFAKKGSRNGQVYIYGIVFNRADAVRYLLNYALDKLDSTNNKREKER